ISTHGYVSAQPEFGKPDTGGQVVYVLELAKCFGRLGFDVDIYTRRFEDQSAVDVVDERVRVVRIPCGGKEFIPKETLCDHVPEWVKNTDEYVRSNGLAYTFINSHYWDAGLAGQSLANKWGIPHVHTPHSIGAWKRDHMDGDAEDLERKYNFRQRVREEKVIYDESDVLIATTPQQRDLLTASAYDAPHEKISVIPPGYDDSRFFPMSLASRQGLKRDLDAEGPIVLALGRMAHNKGYDLLIRAMPFVIRRVPDARLILAVGSTEPSKRETEQIGDLRALADELSVSAAVMFRDYIPDDQLADYYRVADVFALSSRYEPFGMTAVEAMACGTPTVITTEGGLWEQITWGLESIYANPFDPTAFGDAIANVLQYPRIASQLAKHGSQKARARFTWTGVAQQLLRVVETVEPHSGMEEDHDVTGTGPRGRWAVDPAEEQLWKTAVS
ncbi:MAG: glycosyltransferase, partial [Planctomycetales bacterium]|nr:glycosyltransferase [Planctomycetales bacterium]